MGEITMKKEFMQQFTSDDCLRPVMTVIFPYDDYCIATDSKQLLMVKKESCDFELDYDEKKHGKPLNVNAVINTSALKPTHSISLADLRAFIERNANEDEVEDVEVPTTFKDCDCDECDNGSVTLTTTANWNGEYFDLEEQVECPVCHGYGKIPTDPEYDPVECSDEDDVKGWITYEHRPTGNKVIGWHTAVKICGNYINAKYLYSIKMLLEYFNMESSDFCIVKNMVAFKFPNTFYVVCLMRPDYDGKEWNNIDEPVPVKELKQ